MTVKELRKILEDREYDKTPVSTRDLDGFWVRADEAYFYDDPELGIVLRVS